MKKLLLAFLLLFSTTISAQPRLVFVVSNPAISVAYDADGIVRQDNIVVTDIYMMLPSPAVSTEGIVFNMTVDLYAIDCVNRQQAVKRRRAFLDREQVAERELDDSWFPIVPESAGALIEKALCGVPPSSGVTA